jgi:hypothetical protein
MRVKSERQENIRKGKLKGRVSDPDPYPDPHGSALI